MESVRLRVSTLALLIACLVTGSGTGVAAEDRVTVGGAGAHIRAMQALAAAYEVRHPDRSVEVLAKNLGSTGAMRATAAGALTIGLVSRRPHPDEGVALVYRAYGRTPLIVAVHADVPVATLTEAQVCEIFAGRVVSWKDVGSAPGRIIVLTRNEDGTKETLREQIRCFRDLREGPDSVVLTKSAAMNEALVQRPGTIGFTDLAAFIEAEQRFRPIAINGVTPSLEALRAGRYPLAKTFGMVTAGEPSAPARHFMEFVTGPDGERILHRLGFIVAR